MYLNLEVKMATVPIKKEVSAVKASVVKTIPAEKKVITTAVKKTPVAKPVVPTAPATRVKAAAKSVGIKPEVTKVVMPKAPIDNVEKLKKPKLIRDSFTMPETEYAILSQVKKSCLKAGVDVKKSQLLRIGLVLLNKTDVPALKKLIADLAPLKAGRPKKEK